jgi:transcriptional regulator with XRE-family HTH domain
MNFPPGAAQQRDHRQMGRSSPRVHISAVGELAAGRDQQLGQIFRNMRVALKITREALARRLATSPMIIDNFEAGAITALPHWKETIRIVRGYCELLRVDPEPILWRIQSQLQSAVSRVQPSSPVPLAPATELPTGRPPAALSKSRHDTVRAAPRRRGRARALFALTAPVVVLVAAFYAAQALPQPIYRMLGVLPAGIAIPLRAAVDYVVNLSAPSRDGLKWIELGDPQLRKSDKLQIASP